MAEEGQQFARLGVAAEGLLGEQDFTVHGEDVGPLAACDERETLDQVLVVAHDVVHRTGGTRPIVSGDAVFKADDVLVHGFAPCLQWYGVRALRSRRFQGPGSREERSSLESGT